jgi:hypothetical protein
MEPAAAWGEVERSRRSTAIDASVRRVLAFLDAIARRLVECDSGHAGALRPFDSRHPTEVLTALNQQQQFGTGSRWTAERADFGQYARAAP